MTPMPSFPTSFLRRVWWADAAVSAVVGAVMAGAAGPLRRADRPAGARCSPSPACRCCRTPPSSPGWRRGSAVPRAAAWAPVLLNVVWAVDCDRARPCCRPTRAPLLHRLHRRPGGHRARLRRARVRRPAARAAGRRGALTPRHARGPSAIVAAWPARTTERPQRRAIPLRSPRRAARRRHRLDGGLPLLLRPQPLRLHPAEHAAGPEVDRAAHLHRHPVPALRRRRPGDRQSPGPAAGRGSGGAGRRSPAARCW